MARIGEARSASFGKKDKIKIFFAIFSVKRAIRAVALRATRPVGVRAPNWCPQTDRQPVGV